MKRKSSEGLERVGPNPPKKQGQGKKWLLSGEQMHLQMLSGEQIHLQGWKTMVAKIVYIPHTNKIVFFSESSSTGLKTFIKFSTHIKRMFTVIWQ